METLPIYVIPDIAKYLSGKDLAACCAVSNLWRDAFGSDEVWKPRCDVNIEEYLRTTPCRVEPGFVTPEPEDITLSPIGRWRTAYMREAHLRRNWVNGNSVEKNFEMPLDCLRMWYLNNDLIVVLKRNAIELRNATGNPSICVAEFALSSQINDKLFDVKEVHGDIFIISTTFDTRTEVTVIVINTETCTLSEKHIYIGGDFEINLHNFVLVNNNVLLAIDSDHMYISNIENGTNLRTESNPQSGSQLCRIYDCKDCEDVLVTSKTEDLDFYFFIYNVKELRFLEFTHTRKLTNETMGILCAIVNNFFALFSLNGDLDVYDYHSSSLTYHIQLPSCPMWYNFIRVRGDSLMYVTSEPEHKLVQVSLSTGSVRCLQQKVFVAKYMDNYRTDCTLLLYENVLQYPNVLWINGSEPRVFTAKIDLRLLESVNTTFSKVLMYKLDPDYEKCTILELW